MVYDANVTTRSMASMVERPFLEPELVLWQVSSLLHVRFQSGIDNPL